MRTAIRRFGLVMLWQYAVCIAVLPVYFLAALLAVANTMPRWFLAVGVILALLLTIGAFRDRIYQFIDKAVLVEPDGEPRRRMRALRVDRQFDVFLATCLLSGLMTIAQTLRVVESSGIVSGLFAYLITWHVMLIFPLMLWARSKGAEQLPPPRGIPASGIAELWIVPPDDDDDEEGGPITVAVKVDGIRSLEEVLVAVLQNQVLPALDGGQRQWLVVVDGTPVGDLTQTWHHPRWWRPIEWTTSPSSLFKGERVTFRPVGSGQHGRPPDPKVRQPWIPILVSYYLSKMPSY
jgi:hypothetical protein